ncbi:MAG: MFS transporter [Dehalococcoidia bacterium]|nr:MFS transporter [Dehalococcoidia bacterium]
MSASSPGTVTPGPRWGALSYPQFQRYWIAQLCRVLGLQFRIIALPWLVSVELDRSPIWLGIVALAGSLPTIVFSVPAGVLADRFNDQKVVVYSQGAYALTALALPVLIFAGLANIWVVIAWSIVTGILAALGNPAQQSLMPRLIEMRVMPSAVALSSMVWSSMRIIGPAAAGVLLAVIGTAEAFFVTAVGVGVGTLLMASLKPRPRGLSQRAEGERDDMWTGLRYIFGHRLFLATIGLSFFTSVFGMSYQFLMPVFANDILDVGEVGFGMLEAATGLGSVLGTVAIIKVGAGRHAGVVMIACAALFGLFIAGFAASRAMPLSMGLLFLAGFFSAMYLNIGMTALQMAVPDDLRGRVMGVWSMTWFLASVGALPAGAVAEVLGAPLSVALGGLSVSAFALFVFFTSPELRHVDLEAAAEGRPATAGT